MKYIAIYFLLLVVYAVPSLQAEPQSVAEINSSFRSMACNADYLYILTKENSILKISIKDGTQKTISLENPSESTFTDLSVLNDQIYLCQSANSDILVLNEKSPKKGFKKISCDPKTIKGIVNVSTSKNEMIIRNTDNDVYQVNGKGVTRKIVSGAAFISRGFPLIAASVDFQKSWQVTVEGKTLSYSGNKEEPVAQLMPIGQDPQNRLIFLEVTGDGTFNSKYYLTSYAKEKFERLSELNSPHLFATRIAVMNDKGDVYRARKDGERNLIVVEKLQ
ncbi:MAG: hypothetical protein KKB51_21760 [Candidatus Riflebacteria bacterium]|nr:hypothetical protein [Candidatus Riflebacteria bacterium]